MRKISLLIIVSSSDHLDELLNSIRNQSYDMTAVEVLFLDNGADSQAIDRLTQFTDDYSYARMISVDEEKNIPEARNDLVTRSEGEILAFTDDDVVLPPDWLKRINKTFREGAEVLGGRMDSHQTGFVPQFENRRKTIWYRHIDRNNIVHLETANLAVDSSVIESLEFDPNVNWAADLDLVRRLQNRGHKITFDIDLKVFHSHPEALLGLLRQHFNYGVGLRRADTRHDVFSHKKKLKMGWYALFPILFPVLLTLNTAAGVLSLLSFTINKYTPRMTVQGLKTGNPVDLSVIFIEPLRYFAFTYGYAYELVLGDWTTKS